MVEVVRSKGLGLNSCAKTAVLSLGPRPVLFSKYSYLYHVTTLLRRNYGIEPPARPIVLSIALLPEPDKAATRPPQGPCRAALRTICGIEPRRNRALQPLVERLAAIAGENLYGSSIFPLP